MKDIQDILEVMPHRYPILLIDRVLEMGEKNIRAIKNVTFNEPHFLGHFPGHPVMPGVLLVEAMAQAAGYLLLSQDSLEKASTLGKEITRERVDEIAAIAKKHGFRLSGFRSFEKEVTPEQIEAVRQSVEKRIAEQT